MKRRKVKSRILLNALMFVLSASVVFTNTSYIVCAQHEANQEVKSQSFDLDKLRITDINYLKETFYDVDDKTDISIDDINVSKFLKEDLSITLDGNKPKILILHSHSTEMYSDSGDKNEGVIGVGEKLRNELENRYGIPTIHNETTFDVVDGEWQPVGAYDRMEYEIVKILEENPSIEIVIDLHRDGVPENNKLVTMINSKPTAQIKFVNGLSKVYDSGNLAEFKALPNNYVYNNLAFSFKMQLTSNNLYPTFANKIYIMPYRYSLHMLPKSLLVEVGAQTNTQKEAENAAIVLAEILAANLLK